MFSSIVAPSGAFSPNVYFVPSGAVASFPSASLYVGASVVTASPAFPSLSAYDGIRLSAVVLISVAVAVIVALSFVIAVPAGVDQTGFSYPSFAVTSGYCSAFNEVPVSYTHLTLPTILLV